MHQTESSNNNIHNKIEYLMRIICVNTWLKLSKFYHGYSKNKEISEHP